ncbi:kinesin-like protein KIF15 [Asterias rubens]|uniref:kinesin-like protein KIF15 n=1 Tax=Asterias rubens TaxID=7604 RepID=UPI001455D517|nr:kinesin-like protein KIF15 [Asterias rubens]
MPSLDNGNDGDGDSIKVYLRVRPPDQDNGLDSSQILTVQPPDMVILPCKPEPKVFTFDHVADINTTQEAVFAAVGKRTIESCVAGYNSTIFAYGQTGSGKTFTMIGPSEDTDTFHHELRGVIPRSFEYLFNLVNREREKQGERFESMCRVSFLEIYNEQIFDLLDPASTGLHLRENFKRGVFVDGLIEKVVTTPSDAYEVLSSGWLNRRVASTSMNRESSRSHAVFTFSIQTKEKKAGVSNIRVSQLNLVDLAGSERQKDTKTSGLRLKEAGSINKSLLTLGHVITALVDISHGKTRHVPYRDSKLSFLLRDSLGGNAKTCIIANVHPGAKCFGETLSTLNFARRAKMIKNKAVVNEDTQGNTAHLQAEIKRLREQLLQVRQGGIPVDVNNPVLLTPTSLTTPSSLLTGSSNNEKKWKNYFLDTMFLREKVENEKKVLLEKITRLEDLCNKKEQSLQSTKMILRFRENTISHLQKSKTQPEESAQSQIMNNLRGEIEALKDQLAHNPTVTKYAMENHNLRHENKKLLALQTVRASIASDNERVQQLEKTFRELMANLEGGDRRKSVCLSPSRTPSQHGDQHIAVLSTFDKYKTQSKQLQAERDSARQELLEQAEVARKTQLKLEAEVASYKKSVNELENALEAMKVKNKIERDTMNSLHMQTIMTITTPKKAAYTLRNRVVTVPKVDSTPLQPCRLEEEDDSPSPLRGAEGIVDEEIPEQMIEQCNEALTDEVRKLQNENSSLVQHLEDEECGSLKLKQTITLLEHELEQRNQLLESEKKEKTSFKDQVAELSAKLQELQKDYCISKSEAEDMKIMLKSADRVTEEKQKRLQIQNMERDRDFASMEAKLLGIEMDVSNKAREIEKITEEKLELQDACGTLQAEVDFKEQRQEELETVVKDERKKHQQMEDEMQSLMEKLDAEFQKNSKLMADLREGSDTKRELLETLEVTERLQNENSDLQTACREKDSELSQSKEESVRMAAMISSLNKRATEEKDALAGMVSTVQDLRATIQLKEDSLNMVTNELEDMRHRCQSLQASLEEYKDEVLGVQRELEEKGEELQNQGWAYSMEMEMLQDDLAEVRGQHDTLMREMTDQLELVQEQVDQLRKQLSDKNEEIKTMQELYEAQLEEAKSNISTVVVETDLETAEMKMTIDSQRVEIATFKSKEKTFTELQEQFEIIREEKNLEIQQLKTTLEKLELVQVDKEILDDKCQMLEYRLEQWQNETREKESETKFTIQELRNEVSRMNVAFDSATKLKDEATEGKLQIESALAQLHCNNQVMGENADQMMEELERVKAVENTHFKEKEDLKSTLEELQEEQMKLHKDKNRLEEIIKEMTAVNAKLAGHQNLKQKIHYHQQVKNENVSLKEQLAKIQNKSKLTRGELEQYKKTFGDLKLNRNGSSSETDNDSSPLKTVKENLDPRLMTL